MFQKIINNDDSNQEKAPHSPNRPQAPQAAQSTAASAPTPAAQPQQTVASRGNRLATDVEIKGTIRFQDELVVDGKVEGEISSTGALTVQENARIRAEIKVGSVIVQGKVHGNITATQSIQLCAGSEVVGDIKAAILTMESGAIFVGKSEVGAPSSQPAAKSSGGNNSAKKPQQGGSKPQQGGQPQKQVAKAS